MRLLLLLSTMFLFVSCSETVPPGHVGLFVKNPFFVGESGVSKEIADPGRHYMVPSTSLVLVETRPIQLKESFDDLFTKGNMPVDFDAFLQIQVIPEKANQLFSKFGQKWYENNLQRQFQELVRSHAKEQDAFALISDAAVGEQIAQTIQKQLSDFVEAEQIPIRIKNVTIGKVSPPQEVINQTAETAAQTQKQKTEAERAKAEHARAEAEKAKALADKAYMREFGMTTKEYLILRSLEIEKEKINMVRDKQNVSIIMGSGNVSPVLDVSANKQ